MKVSAPQQEQNPARPDLVQALRTERPCRIRHHLTR